MNESNKRVADAINNCGLSFRQLSDITGISKSSIEKYSKMKVNNLSIDVIDKIAKATHNDPLYLADWKATESAIDERLMKLINQLDNSKKELLVNLAEQLLANHQDN